MWKQGTLWWKCSESVLCINPKLILRTIFYHVAQCHETKSYCGGIQLIWTPTWSLKKGDAIIIITQNWSGLTVKSGFSCVCGASGFLSANYEFSGRKSKQTKKEILLGNLWKSLLKVVISVFVCFCLQKLPNFIMGLNTMGTRIVVSDIQESFHFVKYKARENHLVIFADDVNPR